MTTLVESHEQGCNCSYCEEPGLHYGLNIPRDWRAWNAWWIVKWGPRRYVRWTMPKWLGRWYWRRG